MIVERSWVQINQTETIDPRGLWVQMSQKHLLASTTPNHQKKKFNL
jgi:hypothetical protein